LSNIPNAGSKSTGSPAADPPWPSARTGWWATTVLFLLYTLSFIDRTVLNLLVEPIKHALAISDFEISLLQGMTFALFYTVFGLFIGTLVDTRPRRMVVFAGVFLWSFATSGCGLAVRYWQLALARVGVAVGEASLAPAGYSLLSDLFPPRKLALPMSVMGAGASVGSAVAFIIGGAILASVPAEGIAIADLVVLHGWQVAFLVVGIPGLLLAPLIFTFREPIRRLSREESGQDIATSREVWRYMHANRRFYYGHFLGFGVYSMINYGVSSWLATFFVRHHGYSVPDAGYAAGSLMLLVGLPGSVLMGLIVDRWFAAGRLDAHLRFITIAFVVQTVCVVIGFSASNPMVSMVALAPQIALAPFTGVAAAALQITTPGRMRGRISAVYLLVFNLLGLGLGPTIVASMTDFVFRDEKMIGYSIIATYLLLAPVGMALMLWAAPEMRRRLTGEAGNR